MTPRQELEEVIEDLPDSRIEQLLRIAGELQDRAEDRELREWGLSQLARCYGEDEPEYALEDVRTPHA